MKKVMGEASAAGRKVKLIEALEDALKNAPPPKRADIQHFKVLAIELEFGGIAARTRTRVTIGSGSISCVL